MDNLSALALEKMVFLESLSVRFPWKLSDVPLPCGILRDWMVSFTCERPVYGRLIRSDGDIRTNPGSYDIDLGPVMLSDYSHTSYYDILKSAYLVPPVFPTIHNNLINGKGIFDCNSTDETICTPWAGLSKFAFRAGKVHRLRLINTGGEVRRSSASMVMS